MAPNPDQTCKREGTGAEMTRIDFKRWLYRGKQWLYRGQRPNWIARMLNRGWAAVGSLGVASNYLVTLEVTGRKSGRIVSLPVVVAFVDGQRYLVSMLGENVQEVHIEEVPRDARAPILRTYLQRAPGARPHVPVNKDAPLAEFEKVAKAFPVFQVVKDVHANSRA